MPTTTARPSRAKSAAATADEAQQPEAADAPPMEGEPVDEKAEARRANTAEMIDSLRTVIVERMRGEMNPKFEKLQGQVDDLAAVATVLQEAQGDGSAQVAQEDFLSDQLNATVDARLRELFGEGKDATGTTLAQRMDGLATALAQHQSDVNQRLHDALVVINRNVNELAADLQAAQLGEASATGVLRDVVAEQRATVPGVYAKVHKLMLQVEEIGKGRQYRAETRGGSGDVEYTFRGIDDAMDAVGAALRVVGLIMRSEVVEAEHSVLAVEKKPGWVQHWATTRLTMRYTFVDPADGSEHAVEGYGVGKDLGDKDGSKASSAAMKYALFQGLCIPVKGMNIDPETENPTDPGPGEVAERPQQRRQEVEPAPEQQRPAVDTPKGTPEERAVLALRAARAAQSEQELTGVLIQAQQEKIMLVEVDGQKLQAHLVALRRTLRPAGGDPQDG